MLVKPATEAKEDNLNSACRMYPGVIDLSVGFGWG